MGKLLANLLNSWIFLVASDCHHPTLQTGSRPDNPGRGGLNAAPGTPTPALAFQVRTPVSLKTVPLQLPFPPKDSDTNCTLNSILVINIS